LKSWIDLACEPVRAARRGEEQIRHLPVHLAVSGALPLKRQRKDSALSARSPFRIGAPSFAEPSNARIKSAIAPPCTAPSI